MAGVRPQARGGVGAYQIQILWFIGAVVLWIVSTVFLGGYKFFGLENAAPVMSPIVVFAKAVFVIFCMLWFRATFPRMRFDHLVGFAWKFLVPLSMVNLMLGALVVKLTPGGTGDLWVEAGLMLLGNLIVIAVTFVIVNRAARKVKDAPALQRITAVER